MKLRIETRRGAEKLAVAVRWALIATAAVLVSDILTKSAVMALLGVAALSNFFAMRQTQAGLYEQSGRRLMEVLRILDGVIIAGAGFVSGAATQNVWMLGIAVLISEAIVSRSRGRVLGLAATILSIHITAQIATSASFAHLALSSSGLLVGAIVGFGLSCFKSREEMLTSHDRRLAAVLDCGSALAASRDLHETILHTLKSAVIETGATCGYVLLTDDEDKGWLRAEAAYGAGGEFEFPERMEVGVGMSGFVAKMGQPVVIADAGDGSEQFDGVTTGVRSAASVPLSARTYTSAGRTATEHVLGAMTLLSLTDTQFDNDDVEMLQALGALIAVAVANARMEERQRTTFLRTLESLATALEARDEYTRGHSQRVCEVSLMIGEHMGFGTEAMEELRVGTILHDIGKIGVPDAILNKRARLTESEFETMKTHPIIGYEICRPLNLSEGVLMIIRNHHEKLDGSGYPDGLKGGELPLSLRIVCVADAFDAMSSRRPYRDVMDPRSVLAELSRGAGTQFDPVVVESLKKLLSEDRLYALYQDHWASRDEKAA